MAKLTKVKMKNKKKLNKRKNIFLIIVGITLVVAVSLMLIGNKMRANIIKAEQEQKNYHDWLVENCECVVKDRIFCPDGFVLRDKLCYNTKIKAFANRLIGCSQYKCEEQTATWNNSTEIWGELQ